MDASLARQLESSRSVEALLYQSCHKVSAPKNHRVILSAGSYQLAMDHHRAMIGLVECGFRASALALLRPLVEGYTMGLWIYHCAKERQLDLILEHRFTRDLSAMQADLDRGDYFGFSIKNEMKDVVRNLHGFTHGGMLHLQWRFKGNAVVADYPDELMVDTLRMADIHAYMAMQGVMELAGNVEMANELRSQIVDRLGRN